MCDGGTDNFSGTLARTHSTEQCTNYLDCASDISSTAPLVLCCTFFRTHVRTRQILLKSLN
jgi:hypothetical protein